MLAQKLGEIQKPAVDSFVLAKKLFCLPLIPRFESETIQKVLQQSIDLFWQQADKQVSELERTGKVSYIFYESVTADGDVGLDVIKQINDQSYNLVKEKLGQGAKLVSIEEEETFNEYLDWSICLSVVRKSYSVLNKILGFHQEISKKRVENIAKKIQDTLQSGETGLLVMTDENRLQVQSLLSDDIQVFLVRPPALNDIEHFFRDYMKQQNEAECS
ncbi:MAG: hypothetical protein WC325_00250 [Candidatus Bathyarchaeia archaeon]|jgi:hypothetical protein